MQDLCLAARQSMVARGKMPPSAHDFALQDLDFSQSHRFRFCLLTSPAAPPAAGSFSQAASSAPPRPGRCLEDTTHLRNHLSDGVALMLGCCGAPAYWAGQQERFAAELTRWQETWERTLGGPGRFWLVPPACASSRTTCPMPGPSPCGKFWKAWTFPRMVCTPLKFLWPCTYPGTTPRGNGGAEGRPSSFSSSGHPLRRTGPGPGVHRMLRFREA